MPKIKKLIIILFAILIIAVIALVVILNMNNNENNQQTITEDENIGSYEKELKTKLEVVTNRMDFYMVKDCVGKYYSYYSIIFNAADYYGTVDEAVIKEAEEQNANVLYNMLDKEYIEAKNITANNMKLSLKTIKNVSVDITNMYVMQKTSNIEVYVVKGNLNENLTMNAEQFQVITIIDLINKTFSIIPQEYVEEQYGDLTVGEETNINVPERIEQNENNTYQYKVVTDEEYVKDLFNEFRNEILYDKTMAYSHLNEEYRNKKFETIEEFNDYLKENEEETKTMKVSKYQKKTTDEYTEYICTDQNDNYYIFRETGIMNYTVILDTYTIDLLEFLEKYNEASEEEKVGLNIQKIFDAINSEDYEYVYDKLDNTFKENNFRTITDFENYMKVNFYAQNNVTYNNWQISGNIYMYNVTITDATEVNKNKIEKTFVMQLKEGTDFVMSFNVS